MKKHNFKDTTITTVDARENFSELVNHAAYGNKRIVLTRRGKPLCVVISLSDYRKLEETTKVDEQ